MRKVKESSLGAHLDPPTQQRPSPTHVKPAHRHNADTEYSKEGLTDCGGKGWERKGQWEEGGEGGGGGPYRESVGNEESRRETSRDNMHTSKRFL